jgi:hypothetical protein
VIFQLQIVTCNNIRGQGQVKVWTLKAKAKAKAWTLKAKAKAKAWTFKAKAKAKASTLKAKAKAKDTKFVLEDPRGQGLASRTTSLAVSECKFKVQ